MGRGKVAYLNISENCISFSFVIPSAEQTVNNTQRRFINSSFSSSFELQILVWRALSHLWDVCLAPKCSSYSICLKYVKCVHYSLREIKKQLSELSLTPYYTEQNGFICNAPVSDDKIIDFQELPLHANSNSIFK